MPPIGLGLWKSAPGEVHAAVKEALLFGCKLLDGAAAYGNEVEVGNAIKEAIDEKSVKREDLWIVSKLFNTHHVWEGDTSRPKAALEKTLKDLQVEYLDLYLMLYTLEDGRAVERDRYVLTGERLPVEELDMSDSEMRAHFRDLAEKITKHWEENGAARFVRSVLE